MDTAKHGHFFSTVTKFGWYKFFKTQGTMQMGGRSRNKKKIYSQSTKKYISIMYKKKEKKKAKPPPPIRSPLSPSIWAAWVRE